MYTDTDGKNIRIWPVYLSLCFYQFTLKVRSIGPHILHVIQAGRCTNIGSDLMKLVMDIYGNNEARRSHKVL